MYKNNPCIVIESLIGLKYYVCECSQPIKFRYPKKLIFNNNLEYYIISYDKEWIEHYYDSNNNYKNVKNMWDELKDDLKHYKRFYETYSFT